MALCTRAAATAESTPPDSPQMARPPPTWARMAATWVSMIDVIVHPGARPQASYKKCSSTSWPCGVCTTSGWNCTP